MCALLLTQNSERNARNVSLACNDKFVVECFVASRYCVYSRAVSLLKRNITWTTPPYAAYAGVVRSATCRPWRNNALWSTFHNAHTLWRTGMSCCDDPTAAGVGGRSSLIPMLCASVSVCFALSAKSKFPAIYVRVCTSRGMHARPRKLVRVLTCSKEERRMVAAVKSGQVMSSIDSLIPG